MIMLPGGYAKWQIQWTETNKAGKYENQCKYAQYSSGNTTDNAGEVKATYQGSQKQPDNLVCSTHVLFHYAEFPAVKNL